MNECRRVRRLLALRDVDRSPAEQALVTAHVQACADCAAWARQCREQDALIRSLLPVRPSPLRSQQFLTKMHTERRRFTMFAQLRTVGNVVATVVFLVGLALAVNFLVPRALPVQEHVPAAGSEVPETTIGIPEVTVEDPEITVETPTVSSTENASTEEPSATPDACASDWFFTFDEVYRDLGAFCPGPARIADAIGQDFEGGRVYRYAPDPAYTVDQRGTIYVIYNDGEWVTFPDTWDATQPSYDPNLIPPEGRYQPVESIGKVWRENADVRERLGWAYELQRSFSGRIQRYSEESTPVGDNHFSFIDHGKWGLVLLLNSVDMGPNEWKVVGYYPTTDDVSEGGTALTIEALRNAEYQAGAYADFYDTVQLTDGAGDLPAWPDDPTMAPHVQLIESDIAFGDLNGDNVDDAVVVLDFHIPGTTGHFKVIAVVVNRDGEPHNIATQAIGDRTVIEATTIQSGEVMMNAIIHGPDDPLCCPSMPVAWQFKLEGNAIVWLSDSTPSSTTSFIDSWTP